MILSYLPYRSCKVSSTLLLGSTGRIFPKPIGIISINRSVTWFCSANPASAQTSVCSRSTALIFTGISSSAAFLIPSSTFESFPPPVRTRYSFSSGVSRLTLMLSMPACFSCATFSFKSTPFVVRCTESTPLICLILQNSSSIFG